MADNSDLPSGSAGGSTSFSIDSNSPLYIHPSDNPGAMFVPVQFTGIGYRSWRRSVLRSLYVKNKLGFINGDCQRPQSDHPSYRQWERCDNIVTSWILNSLSKDIADSVEFVMSSAELWRELEDRYEQPNGAKLYQIQREINDLSQGSLDITWYYTKLKKLWEELSSLNVTAHCNCACNCGAKALAHKAEQDRRLIQFRMGLNEIYTVIRGNILMMNPLPNMAQAFSLLVQDEQQREIKPSNHFNVDSTALHVGSGKPSQPYKTNFSSNHPRIGSQIPYKDRFCNYCRRTGHLMEKCYQLHGYPSGSSSGPTSNNDNPNQKTYPYNNPAPRPNNFRPPKPSQNTNPHRYPRGSGNRPVANAHCTHDSAPGNGPLMDQHE
ncbi:hypothetical protein KY284_023089 [Solanum tuberosum]|nr:hypothetical protein KY284_023089 [Solanum tuberosum]